MKEQFFFRDKVKCNVDIYKNDKIYVPAGTSGEILNITYTDSFAEVVFDGKVQSRQVHTEDLDLIEKNIQGRIEYEESEKKHKKIMKELNLKINDIIEVKDILSTRIFKVHVIRVEETGFYGYRLTKDNERCKGKLGIETYFTTYQIYDNNRKLKDSKKTENIQVGFYCLMPEMMRNNTVGIGIVTKVTLRSVYIDWGWMKERYSRKSFQYHALSKDKIQNEINNSNATKETIIRFKELGFNINNVTEKEKWNPQGIKFS